MKAKIQLFSAFTIACLTSGCIVPAPYYSRPVGYGAPVEAYPAYPDEIYVPEVIIVEGGVRHDRYFYQLHPEYYRRDRLRYPERFAHMPPPRHEAVVRGPVPAVHAVAGRPTGSVAPQATPSKDSKDKKKKHNDDDHDR